MNGHPPYLLAVLAILFAVVAFAVSRLFSDRRVHLERSGKRLGKPPREQGIVPPSDEL